MLLYIVNSSRDWLKIFTFLIMIVDLYSYFCSTPEITDKHMDSRERKKYLYSSCAQLYGVRKAILDLVEF